MFKRTMMFAAAPVLALLCLAPLASGQPAVQWTKSTEVYTNPENSFLPLIMFGNTSTQTYKDAVGVIAGFGFNKFIPFDLKPVGVTADAKYADIGGLLINTGAGELEVTFRAPGNTQNLNYQWQQLSVGSGNGLRTVVTDKVPLSNGVFEAMFVVKNYPNTGAFPLGSSNPAIGWNIKLKGWGR